MARDLIASGNHTVASVAESLGVHRATWWRHLAAAAYAGGIFPRNFD